MNKHRDLALKGFIHKTGKEEKVISSREYSHDDGQHSGPFFGGLGTPSFSRDFDGYFSRWHLEPGVHVQHKMQEAYFIVSWEGTLNNNKIKGFTELNSTAFEKGFKREVTALFPCMWETYSHDELPFTIILKTWSPFVSGDLKASSLPLVFFDIQIECDESMQDSWKIASAFFFPNLLGWRNGFITPVDRTKTPFPAQTHAGNTCLPYEFSFDNRSTSAIIQTKNTAYKNCVKRSLEGEIMHFVYADSNANITREVCYKAGMNRIGIAEAEQEHTINWVREKFILTNELPMSELSWQAHWDEALGSALAVTYDCTKSTVAKATYSLAIDCPITEFGKSRKWYTKYTEYFGTSGHNSSSIAKYALENCDSWREEVYNWHKKYVEESSLPIEIALTQINELYFLIGGGTAFVRQLVDKEDVSEPRLGDKEHFGLLEGFDIGYYYYNTVDLWVFSFAALSRHFPELAQSVFDDILATIPLEIPKKHMIYREFEMRPILVKGKIPHDFGAAPSDPWHDLNGYQMRDDSNQWLDHVPTNLVSYYLHCKKTGRKIPQEDWVKIKQACYFMLSQQEDDALPHHKAFGDSTWDNLGLKGVCTYTSTAVIAAYHVIIEWAKDFEESELIQVLEAQLDKAYPNFDKHLWTGEYFRACTVGSYENCLMGDSLIWLMYLDMAGIEHRIEKNKIKKHLEAAYKFNYKKHGFHGPLLICEPERGSFPPDGGDIGLQVNEVLLGSAWTTIALMKYYGLEDEFKDISYDMANYQHKESSLHFRSPAAWDDQKRFRAPLNMRPLAISLLDWK